MMAGTPQIKSQRIVLSHWVSSQVKDPSLSDVTHCECIATRILDGDLLMRLASVVTCTPLGKPFSQTLCNHWSFNIIRVLKTILPPETLASTDVSKIVAGDEDAILDVIWKLFLVSEGKQLKSSQVDNEINEVKASLVAWCNQQASAALLPESQDFSSSWWNSWIFSRLAEAFFQKPVDVQTPEDMDRLSSALSSFEVNFSLPQAISVEDICTGHCDERALIVYTACLRDAVSRHRTLTRVKRRLEALVACAELCKEYREGSRRVEDWIKTEINRLTPNPPPDIQTPTSARAELRRLQDLQLEEKPIREQEVRRLLDLLCLLSAKTGGEGERFLTDYDRSFPARSEEALRQFESALSDRKVCLLEFLKRFERVQAEIEGLKRRIICLRGWLEKMQGTVDHLCETKSISNVIFVNNLRNQLECHAGRFTGLTQAYERLRTLSPNSTELDNVMRSIGLLQTRWHKLRGEDLQRLEEASSRRWANELESIRQDLCSFEIEFCPAAVQERLKLASSADAANGQPFCEGCLMSCRMADNRLKSIRCTSKYCYSGLPDSNADEPAVELISEQVDQYALNYTTISRLINCASSELEAYAKNYKLLEDIATHTAGVRQCLTTSRHLQSTHPNLATARIPSLSRQQNLQLLRFEEDIAVRRAQWRNLKALYEARLRKSRTLEGSAQPLSAFKVLAVRVKDTEDLWTQLKASAQTWRFLLNECLQAAARYAITWEIDHSISMFGVLLENFMEVRPNFRRPQDKHYPLGIFWEGRDAITCAKTMTANVCSKLKDMEEKSTLNDFKAVFETLMCKDKFKMEPYPENSSNSLLNLLSWSEVNVFTFLSDDFSGEKIGGGKCIDQLHLSMLSKEQSRCHSTLVHKAEAFGWYCEDADEDAAYREACEEYEKWIDHIQKRLLQLQKWKKGDAVDLGALCRVILEASLRTGHRESLQAQRDKCLANRRIALPHYRLECLKGSYDRMEAKWNALQSSLAPCRELAAFPLHIRDYILQCASICETRLEILRQDWRLHQPLPYTLAATEKLIDQVKALGSEVHELKDRTTGLEYLAQSFLTKDTPDATAVNSRLETFRRDLSNFEPMHRQRQNDLCDHRAYIDCRDSQDYSALRLLEISLRETYLKQVQHSQDLIDGAAVGEFATMSTQQILNRALRLSALLKEMREELQDIWDSLEMDVNFWPSGDLEEYNALRPQNMRLSVDVSTQKDGIRSLLSRLNARIEILKTEAQSVPPKRSTENIQDERRSTTGDPGVVKDGTRHLSPEMSSDDALYNLECDFDEQRRVVNFYSSKVSLLHPEDVDVAVRFARRLEALESEQCSNLQVLEQLTSETDTLPECQSRVSLLIAEYGELKRQCVNLRSTCEDGSKCLPPNVSFCLRCLGMLQKECSLFQNDRLEYCLGPNNYTAAAFSCYEERLRAQLMSLKACTNVAKHLSTILTDDSAKMSSAGQVSEEICKNLQSLLICLTERTTSLKSRICWSGQNGDICRKLNILSSRIASLHCALLGLKSERHFSRNLHALKGLEIEVGQLRNHLEACVRDDAFAAITDVRCVYFWETDQVGQLSQRLLECRLQLQTNQLCLDAIQRLEELCDLCTALQLRLGHIDEDVLFRPTPISSKSLVQEFETIKTEYIRILQLLRSLISTDRDAIKGRDPPDELVALYGGKLAELRQGLTCVLSSLTRIRSSLPCRLRVIQFLSRAARFDSVLCNLLSGTPAISTNMQQGDGPSATMCASTIHILTSLLPTLVMDGEAALKDMEEYAANKAVAMHTNMTANLETCGMKSVAEWLEYLRSCQQLLPQSFS